MSTCHPLIDRSCDQAIRARRGWQEFAGQRSEERRVGKERRSLCDWSSDVCSSDLPRMTMCADQRMNRLPWEDGLLTADRCANTRAASPAPSPSQTCPLAILSLTAVATRLFGRDGGGKNSLGRDRKSVV